MFIPAIQEYQCYRQFLRDFVAENKKQNAKISHRFLAMRLKWPPVHLSQILCGARPLTLRRALEFAAYAKLDPLDTERLIVLVLKESNDHVLRSYAQASTVSSPTPHNVDASNAAGVFAGQLLNSYLLIGQPVPPVTEIKKTLVANGLLSETEILSGLEFLRRRGQIVADPDGGERFVHCDSKWRKFESPEVVEQFLPYYRRYFTAAIEQIDRTKMPLTGITGSYRLSKEVVEKVTSKIVQLLRWTSELHAKSATLDTEFYSLTLSFQPLSPTPTLPAQKGSGVSRARNAAADLTM